MAILVLIFTLYGFMRFTVAKQFFLASMVGVLGSFLAYYITTSIGI